MKRQGNLWEQFISKENFELAAKRAAKGKLSGKHKQREVVKFMADFDKNVEATRSLVADGKYKQSEYKILKLYDGKERTAYILPFTPDRVVQHAVMNVLKPILIKKLDKHTYSCIDGRGMHLAGQQVMKIARSCKYMLKMDISKFFPSIDQNILYRQVQRIIKDKKFLTILHEIIFANGTGKGVMLGSYMAQWLSNLYLHDLDCFVRHTLKQHWHVRYCDDFIIGGNSIHLLSEIKNNIFTFLEKRLKIKTSYAEVLPVNKGVYFCGYRYHRDHIELRKSTMQKQLKNARKVTEQGWQSITGHCKWCCSYNHIKRMEGKRNDVRMENR